MGKFAQKKSGLRGSPVFIMEYLDSCAEWVRLLELQFASWRVGRWVRAWTRKEWSVSCKCNVVDVYSSNANLYANLPLFGRCSGDRLATAPSNLPLIYCIVARPRAVKLRPSSSTRHPPASTHCWPEPDSASATPTRSQQPVARFPLAGTVECGDRLNGANAIASHRRGLACRPPPRSARMQFWFLPPFPSGAVVAMSTGMRKRVGLVM